MGRYHIFKLGLAVLFYAAFCVRPMVAYGQNSDDSETQNKSARVLNPDDYYVYYQGVEGTPGIDFPILSHIPRTSFSCKEVESGYYADLETDCQVFHICDEGQKISFLCPNGTIFQQADLICEWWFKVNCTNSPNLYEESAEQLRDYLARKKQFRRVRINGDVSNHGAVMRTEEQSSISTKRNGKTLEVHMKRSGKRVDEFDSNNINEDSNKSSRVGTKDLERRREYKNSDPQRQLQPSSDETLYREESNYSFGNKFDNQRRSSTVRNNIYNNNYNPQNNLANVDSQKAETQVQSKSNKNVLLDQDVSNNRRNHNRFPENSQVPANRFTANINADNQIQSKFNEEFPLDHDVSNNRGNPNKLAAQLHVPVNKFKADANVNSVNQGVRINEDGEAERKITHGIQNANRGEVKYNPVSFSQGFHLSGRNHGEDVDNTATQSSVAYYTSHKSNETLVSSGLKQKELTDIVQKSKTQSHNEYTSSIYKSSTTAVRSTVTEDSGLVFPEYTEDNSENRKSKSEYSDINSTQSFVHQNNQNVYYTTKFISNSHNLEGSSGLSYGSSSTKPSSVEDSTTKESSTQNIIVGSGINNKRLDSNDSDESQITQESASFYRSPLNTITDNSKSSPNPYPNHRTTYSDVRLSSPYNNKHQSPISSVTPQYLTTQPINNGKPFVGSRVGTIPYQSKQPTSDTLYETSTVSKIQDKTVESQDFTKYYFGIIRKSVHQNITTTVPPLLPNQLGQFVNFKNSHLYNLGIKDKKLPVVTTEKVTSRPLPWFSLFNTGKTNTLTTAKAIKAATSTPILEKSSYPVGSEAINITFGSNVISSTAPSFKHSYSTINARTISTTAKQQVFTSDKISNSDLTKISDSLMQITRAEPTSTTVLPTLQPSVETSTKTNPDHATVYGTFPKRPSTTPLPKNNFNNNEKINLRLYTTSDFQNKHKLELASTLSPPHVSLKFSNSESSSIKPQSPKLPSTTPLPKNNFNGNKTINLQLYTTSEFQNKHKLELASTLSPPYVSLKFSNSESSSIKPKSFSTTLTPFKVNQKPSGFFVTRNSIEEFDGPTISTTTSYPIMSSFTPSPSSYYSKKSDVQKPRPFQPSNLIEDSRSSSKPPTEGYNSILTTVPIYKISSASPFVVASTTEAAIPSTPAPTIPTPFTSPSNDLSSVYENVDNMINVLMEIAKVQNKDDPSAQTSRPGLIIPPSVGPQTLHTLAVYFANALDGIASEKDKHGQDKATNEEKLAAILTRMTVDKYNELFEKQVPKYKDNEPTEPTSTLSSRISSVEDDNGLEAQDSKNLVQAPQIRQLARNFSLALSSYLDDPVTFRKDLESYRPTEPPPLSSTEEITEIGDNAAGDEELLNFSDADKPAYPPFFSTAPSVSPTWGYILALNNITKQNNLDVKNSLNPDLQSSDSQSFIPGYNSIHVKNEDKNSSKVETRTLPPNHWTSSQNATNLWRTTFSVNPRQFNEHFETTEPITTPATHTDDSIDETEISDDVTPGSIEVPHHEIKYELRTLPQFTLNSTQVHGILIDFMNTTKSDDSNRLQRILKKLNTTESEFLQKMREIESNPLTRRLILLLISECGANVTQEIEGMAATLQTNSDSSKGNEEVLIQSSSNYAVQHSGEVNLKRNSNLDSISPSLNKDGEDTRALHLLNSLYQIASKFGK